MSSLFSAVRKALSGGSSSSTQTHTPSFSSKAIYISVDLEASGSEPEKNFVNEIGGVAFKPDGTEVGRIQLFLSPPEGRDWNPKTLEWYQKQPGYTEWQVEGNRVPYATGWNQFKDWVMKMHGDHGKAPIVFVGYPTIFDGSLVYHEWITHCGHPTNGRGVGFNFADIRSVAMGVFGVCYMDATNKRGPLKECEPKDAPHTHLAVDDAYQQGLLFFNLMAKGAELWGQREEKQ